MESEVNLEQQQINTMFNAAICQNALSDDQKMDFTDHLIKLCTNKLESLSESSTVKDKNDIKISHYFLHVFAMKMEAISKASLSTVSGTDETKKGKGKGKSRAAESNFQWSDWRPAVLRLYLRFLAVDPSLLWFMGIPEEAFLQGMWKYALTCLEDRPSGVSGVGQQETALRGLCSAIVLGNARQLGASSSSGDEMTTLVSAAVDSICRNEHMGDYIAELCKNDSGRFVAALMTEIGGMNLSELGKSGAGIKHIGAFLVSLAECAPQLMAVYLPMFIHQLDSEVYQIRYATHH